MKLAHLAEIRVFSNEDEDEKAIIGKLKEIVVFDEKIKITETNATGFKEKKIKILGIRLEKDSQINKFLQNLTEKLSKEQKELLIRQAESRLDSEFNFFLRLDKEKLLKESRYWITDSGSCYHVKIVVACFPRTREKALEAVRNIFK